MVTRDVLKVLKLHSPTARAILRTFKTSLVLINPEMHEQVHTLSYTKYSYQRGDVTGACYVGESRTRAFRYTNPGASLLRNLRLYTLRPLPSEKSGRGRLYTGYAGSKIRAYEVKNIFCLFERPFKEKKNGGFFF